MNLLISHSSNDVKYTESIVELLLKLNIPGNRIICTSLPGYMIPSGENITSWFKRNITQDTFFISMLTDNYFDSNWCQGEAGMAIHAQCKFILISPKSFDYSNSKFVNSIFNNHDKITQINEEAGVCLFIESILDHFKISPIVSLSLITKEIRSFLTNINNINNLLLNMNKLLSESVEAKLKENIALNNGITYNVNSFEILLNTSDNQAYLVVNLNAGLNNTLKYDRLLIIPEWSFALILSWGDINHIDESALEQSYRLPLDISKKRTYTGNIAFKIPNGIKKAYLIFYDIFSHQQVGSTRYIVLTFN